MWYQNRFFKYTIGAILVLIIISLVINISFLVNPLIDFIATLFFPILLAGVFYYILRPIVHHLEKKLFIPRFAAILIIYFFFLITFIILMVYFGPNLIEQINTYAIEPSKKLNVVREKTIDFMNLLHLNVFSSEDLKDMLTALLLKINTLISNNILEALSTVTRFAVLVFITPFILFYFLKDDHRFFTFFLRLMPGSYQKETKMYLQDIDLALSTFIMGQLLVASILGGLLFIGYLAIGLNNAFLLALFATIFVTIPILGSLIAIIPALLIGLLESPFMAFKVVMVVLSAQMLEANLISPQIMAQRLHIHPLPLMLVLLASGSLYGILGLFLATPIYAIIKVVITDTLKLYNHSHD